MMKVRESLGYLSVTLYNRAAIFFNAIVSSLGMDWESQERHFNSHQAFTPLNNIAAHVFQWNCKLAYS